MTLIPTTGGSEQIYFNDSTKQYHLVSVHPATAVVTDLGAIAQADQLAALASLETQVDLTTAAVASLETQQDLTTDAIASLETQQDLTTDAVDANTTQVDLTTAAVASLETQQDLTTDAVDANTTQVDLVTAEITALNAIDTTTGARTIVDYAHKEIHSGGSFVVSDVVSVSTTTQKWLVTTPDSTKYAHMLFGAEGTGEMKMTITQGATHTGTTGLTEVNHNQVGTPAVATTIAHRDVTVASPVTSDGTLVLFSERSGATGQGNKTISIGGSRANNEFKLKPNTKYTVAVETFAAIYVTLILNWYEHTDLA